MYIRIGKSTRKISELLSGTKFKYLAKNQGVISAMIVGSDHVGKTDGLATFVNLETGDLATMDINEEVMLTYETILLGALNYGEVFEHDDRYYMVIKTQIDSFEDDSYVVRLRDGELFELSNDTLVRPITNVTLSIEPEV